MCGKRAQWTALPPAPQKGSRRRKGRPSFWDSLDRRQPMWRAISSGQIENQACSLDPCKMQLLLNYVENKNQVQISVYFSLHQNNEESIVHQSNYSILINESLCGAVVSIWVSEDNGWNHLTLMNAIHLNANSGVYFRISLNRWASYFDVELFMILFFRVGFACERNDGFCGVSEATSEISVNSMCLLKRIRTAFDELK